MAVRSSATSEDSPDASFAGEHDTYLWVRGAEDVIDAVRRCWASLFTDRATCYRVEMGYDHRSVEMSVVVQKMVHPKAAGVAFTLDPTNGDRSQVAIDAALGLRRGGRGGRGDARQLPHRQGDARHHAPRRQRQDATSTCSPTTTRSRRCETDPDRATAPCLTDNELRAITKLAKTAERHYGCPQDIEWAVDLDLPEGENVILLQSRPETVWSKKGPDARRRAGGEHRRLHVEHRLDAHVAAVQQVRRRHLTDSSHPCDSTVAAAGTDRPTGFDKERTWPETSRSRRRSRRRPAPRAGRSCTRTRRRSATRVASTRTRCSGSRTACTGRRPSCPWDASLMEFAIMALGQYNTRHLLVPAGQRHRLPHPQRLHLPLARSPAPEADIPTRAEQFMAARRPLLP